MANFPATSDAGPLIHLAKIGLLRLLRDNYKTITIPREVKAEVVDRGRERGFADALLVEEAINEGWITVTDVRVTAEFVELCSRSGVDKGEAEVLRYARDKGDVALLDDEASRELARSLGIPVKGTLGVLVESVRRGSLTRQEASRKLDELSDILYMSGELYRRTRRALEQD